MPLTGHFPYSGTDVLNLCKKHSLALYTQGHFPYAMNGFVAPVATGCEQQN